MVAPDGAKPVARLDEVAARGLRQLARPDLLVVRQVGVLEDDLDDRTGGVRDLHHRGDVRLHLGVPTRPEGADEQHHVQLRGAVGERWRASATLMAVDVVAVREADGRADLDVGAAQDVRGPHDVRRAAAHGCHVVRRRPARSPRSTNASSSSGRSSEWSMTLATS